MQIYQLNRDAIRNHAQQAREREQSRGGGEGDIKWYDWKNGENVLRLMVPFSQRGLLFKEVGKHYDIPTLQEGAQEKNPLCLNITFSEIPGIVCPFCSNMEAFSQQYPGFSASDYRPSRNGYTWVIDRRAMDVGPQLARFPAGVFDWVMIQLDNVEWDIANPYNGVDIHITKTGSGKKGTKYVPTLSPQRTALAPNDEILAFWLSKIKDLDIIFKLPEGADMDVYTARAQKFFQMLVLKARQREEAQKNQSMGTLVNPANPLPVTPPAPVGHTGYPTAPTPGLPPGTPTVSAPAIPTAPGVQPPAAPAAPAAPTIPTAPAVPTATPPAPPGLPAPATASAPPSAVPTTAAPPPPVPAPTAAAPTPPAPTAPAPAPAAPPAPVPAAAPPAPAPAAPPAPTPPVATQPAAPTQPGVPPAPTTPAPQQPTAPPPVNTPHPDCWGGSKPHEDGTLGYQQTLSKCQTCEHEFTCSDELAKRIQSGQIKT